MPAVVSVAPIGSIVSLKPIEIDVDRLGHLLFDDLSDGLPAEGAKPLAPIQAVRLHRLHDFKCHR